MDKTSIITNLSFYYSKIIKWFLIFTLIFLSSTGHSQSTTRVKVAYKNIDLTQFEKVQKTQKTEFRPVQSSKKLQRKHRQTKSIYKSTPAAIQSLVQDQQLLQKSIYPSLRYTGRSELDPLGTLRSNEISLIESKFSQRGINRWGDYSAMTVDPVDDCTFWYTGSYVGSDEKTALSIGTWSTRIASFRFPECGGQYDVPLQNFDGIDFTGSFPPDPVGDVGLHHYIQMTNSPSGAVFSIFSKQDGSKITGPLELSTLWQGSGDCINGRGDPIVVWDQFADRWVMMELGRNLRSLCLYISVSDDPVFGGWYSYQIDTPNFPDYPKMAVYADTNEQGAYLITSNEPEAAVYVLDRAAMLAGNNATVKRLVIPRLPGFAFQALTPADVEGNNALKPGTPAYVIRHFDDEIHAPDYALENYDFIELWSIDLGFKTKSKIRISGINRIPVPDFESELCGFISSGCFGQPKTGTKLDPIFEVAMWRVTHRNLGDEQVLLGNFTVDTNGNDQGGIRWFELRKEDNGLWNTHQQATWSPDSANRWMGSIAMDGYGNIAIGYTVSAADPEIIDQNEPNNSILNATPIACGINNHTASITGNNDVDYYYMEGNAGLTAKINIDAAIDNSPLNSLLGVFDTNFQLLQSNETGQAPEEFITEDSYLIQSIPENGGLYIAVSTSGDHTFEGKNGQSSGFYRLSINCEESKVDPFEPNNSFLTATSATCPMETMDTDIGTAFDADYFKFNLLPPKKTIKFSADTSDSSSPFELTMRIFNNTGQLLSTQNTTVNNTLSIQTQTPQNGVLFVSLAASDLTSTGKYSLQCQ